MKIERHRGNQERLILTSMIVDDQALAKIATQWKGDLFQSKWANLIGSWCADYHRKYGKAPGRHIQDIVNEWASKDAPKETVQLIDRFLSGLSDEYEQNGNSAYSLDQAGDYFNSVRARRLVEQVEECVETGQSTKALELIQGFRRLELGQNAWVDPFSPEVFSSVFDDPVESIIKLPGSLKTFFGRSLCRDAFISFLGSEKRGKSFFLMEMVYRALCSRCRTAYFEVGDMSQRQVLDRLACRISRRPLRTEEVKIPISISRDPDQSMADVLHDCRELKGLTKAEGFKAVKRFLKTKVRGHGFLRMSCYSSGTISAEQIRHRIQDWAMEGWRADCVVIDYSDLLEGPSGFEGRDQINETWKQLRRLSQDMHCLVITATQADARSYDAAGLSMRNFSEDKRKLSHVTGMVGLSQTGEERVQGITRLNWIVRREADSFASRYLHVAGCLPLASPVIKSTF